MVPWLDGALEVCVRMSFRKLDCKSASLVMIGGVPFPFCRVWDQDLCPPTGGSASVNIMSGFCVLLSRYERLCMLLHCV